MTIGLVAANLGTVSAEGFLYGIFFMLSGTSSYLLMRRERVRNPGGITLRGLATSPMIVFSVLIIIAVTAHWVLVVEQSFLAFLYFEGGTEALFEYADYALWPWLSRICLLDFTLATFDAVMVYRVWVIWNHSLSAIALPAAFYVGELVCSIGQIYHLSIYQIGASLAPLNPWLYGATSLTLATNLSCAVLISWKLVRSHSRAKSIGTSLLSILAIIIESAAIYVAWSIAYLVSEIIFSNIRDPFVDLWAPVAGIAFMMINVRVGAGLGKHNVYASSSGSPATIRTGLQGQAKDAMELGTVHQVESNTDVSEGASYNIKGHSLSTSMDEDRAQIV